MMRSNRDARSPWHRQLSLLLKLLAVLSLVAYLFLNVTIIAYLPNTRTPSLRSSDPPGNTDAAAHIQAVQTSEKAWWLRPETYGRKHGCDFSAAVALFKPEELELNCVNMDKLEKGEFLGKGFWREVYKTKWKGREVAVKYVKEIHVNRTDIVTRHVEECASIFPIRNQPNIVKLVGWCKTTVVVEYIPHQLDKLVFESKEPISVRRALELARDAARGVAQLHNAPGGPFAHTDLQVRQFLVDANGTLKLNDFNRVKYAGLRLVDGVPSGEKCMFGSEVAKGKWRSPEEYQHLRQDEKLDIYSLSLVLWTLRARVKPFRMYSKSKVYEMVPKGVRPSVEEMSDYPQEMQDLIVRGWDNDPKKRPTAKEMADEIERILANYRDSR
ncbi:unnamed protein product [Peronospora effusa]|uniref:Protein kinase domain-containing protein n=1 Tax=Peronospora effusa TaxID=542832 RepID=A0A3M6VTV3_9STRA|nr:hypothetical protein DD238_001055 [Peronospora effusa]RQM17908.1 hypothetical protein DD237_002234 [Peronospora effusa]CAI5705820.1 unnamed protein product [Peronospora effusa]